LDKKVILLNTIELAYEINPYIVNYLKIFFFFIGFPSSNQLDVKIAVKRAICGTRLHGGVVQAEL
jgi:hypothetical protein